MKTTSYGRRFGNSCSGLLGLAFLASEVSWPALVTKCLGTVVAGSTSSLARFLSA